MKELLISIIVVLLIVIVLMKFKDHFHNYTKDTIPNDSYMNHVIDAILFDLNGRYNTNFGFSSIENIHSSDSNYIVVVFLHELDYDISLKVEFDLNIDSEGNIIINKIKKLNADVPMERSLDNGRGSLVYKTNLGKYLGNNDTELEYDSFPIQETKNKMKNRTQWLFDDKTTEIIKNKSKQFPCKISKSKWDENGVEEVEIVDNNLGENENDIGVYYGTSQPNIVPTFNPTIFVRNEDQYKWLFDVASDVASRPVGITGSRGTK
jgi:hypothetical protein